jgi:hypothetical protein
VEADYLSPRDGINGALIEIGRPGGHMSTTTTHTKGRAMRRIYKPWKYGTKPTEASKRSVDIGTRLFLNGEDFLHFWSLAPAVPGVRRNTLVGTTEFVWLIDDESRQLWHALVDKDTDEVHWRLPAGWEGKGRSIFDGYQVARLAVAA